MSAPSLYRRHRPRSFDDVVGQEHVVRTLRNAIEQDKVHHAYLFVGSRGTGKTSMAKILAACLNCQGDPGLPETERRPGPTTAPCGRCEACRSIADATSIDVVEMDAASNNSVDDIRDLRDSVAFAPVGGRHKVYILDEAHMLSSAAWNAFLKTLEEPPPRTIFVLATTEANKVLPTVVDRCHRFDFHRPTPVQLSRVLDRVAQQESIAIGPEAVALVARHATGSFRDALGTLEQLVTYAGEDIRTEDVLSVLGVADAELLFRAFDAVGSGDAAATLQVASELSAQGRDLVQVTRDVEAHARALLLVLMTGGLPDELRISPDRDERTVAQARTLSGATVIRVIDLVAAALSAVRDGADPRTQLELLLVRAALPQIDPQAKALAARIARLEQAAQGAAPPPVPAIPVAAPVAPRAIAPAPVAPQGAAPAPTAPPASANPAAAAPAAPAAAAPTSPASAASTAPGPQQTPATLDRPAPAYGEHAQPGVPTRPAPAQADAATPVPPRGDLSRSAEAPVPGSFAPRPESPLRSDVVPQAPAADRWADTAESGPPPAPPLGGQPPVPSETPAPHGPRPTDDVPPASDARPTPPAPSPAPTSTAPPAVASPYDDAPPYDETYADDDVRSSGGPSSPGGQAASGSAPATRAPTTTPPSSESAAAPAPPAPASTAPASTAAAPTVPAAARTPAPAPMAPPAPAPTAPAPGPPPVAVGLSPADIDEQLPGIADGMGGAVKAALGQARAVSVTGVDLVLGVPAGKATAARTINREDAKEKISRELEELLGVRFVIRAEEQAGVEAPQEQLLPEDEVVRRVLTEFEAEEVGDGASGVASPGVDPDPSSAPETTTRTHGEP